MDHLNERYEKSREYKEKPLQAEFSFTMVFPCAFEIPPSSSLNPN